MTAETKPKAGLYPIDRAEPAPWPRLTSTLDLGEPLPSLEPARRRNPAWRWLKTSALALFLGVVVLDLALFLNGLFERSLALGVVFSFLIGATAAALIFWIGFEIRQIHKLANVEAIRVHAAEAMSRDGHAGHFAIAVEGMNPSEGIGGPDGLFAPRHHRGNAGADDGGLVADQGEMPDPHPRNIGDRIPWSRLELADGDAEITQALAGHATSLFIILSMGLYPASFFFSNSFSNAGLALPPVARITWPTK